MLLFKHNTIKNCLEYLPPLFSLEETETLEMVELNHITHNFLAHLWGAYAIPVALSGVRRSSSVVCRLCPP